MNENDVSLEDSNTGVHAGLLRRAENDVACDMGHKLEWRRDMLMQHARTSPDLPRPHVVTADPPHPDTPPMYSNEFFGKMGHRQAESLLATNGSYLIRQGKQLPACYILSLRFGHQVLHYKLFYNMAERKHYVKEDQYFNSIHELVCDGLFCLYLDLQCQDYDKMIEDQSASELSKYTLTNAKKLQAGAQEGDDDRASQCSTLAPVGAGLKEHNFTLFSIKGMNWCAVCANLLWGFMSQGIKCADCGLVAHNRCVHKVADDCCGGAVGTPPSAGGRACFGRDLSATARATRDTVPWVVRKCVQEIEARGMHSEGIYRVSGFAEEIDALKLAIDTEGPATDMSVIAYENINVVAGVLKLYLRTLPTPLINVEAFKELMVATGASVAPPLQLGLVRAALALLPTAHYHTLGYLARHLSRVAGLHRANKMPVRNIATVLCPSVMPLPSVLAGSPPPDMAREIHLLAVIIAHNEAVFVQ